PRRCRPGAPSPRPSSAGAGAHARAASVRWRLRAAGRAPYASSFCFGGRLPPEHVIGRIDVAWRGEVVARDGLRRDLPKPFVGNVPPGGAREQHGMEPDTAVGRCEAWGARLAPGGDDAVDGAWVEIRTVAEDDDRRVHLRTERCEPA